MHVTISIERCDDTAVTLERLVTSRDARDPASTRLAGVTSMRCALETADERDLLALTLRHAVSRHCLSPEMCSRYTSRARD